VTRVRIAAKLFKARGQRSRSYEYNAIMVEACTSTAWPVVSLIKSCSGVSHPAQHSRAHLGTDSCQDWPEICKKSKFSWLKRLTAQFLQRVGIARNAERCNSQRDSVCLSVRPSHSGIVSRRMKIRSIVRFSASGRIIPLVSEEVKFIQRGVKVRHLSIDSDNLTNNRP